MKRPRVCILRTDGINCDEETFYAFEKAGAESQMVHVNQLRGQKKQLADYQIMALPGGFSYGDDVHSGKVLAVELTSFLKEQLSEFVASGKLMIGICNGFQVLVRTGLLPYQNLGNIEATLTTNDSGHFECRWITLRVEQSHCVFTRGMAGSLIDIQVAHGEGKFYANPSVIDQIEKNGQMVFRYAGMDGKPASLYPANPNGSLNAIAGICDPTGRIMGMMPHPERYVEKTHHPNWRRMPVNTVPHGLAIFKNAVDYARQM
ncbi:MAG: phosphoribosylformylglycinamidine synthase I [Desulfotomaculaceae bacterium]|nr:phosphoribosylformylglycinamidine synthase I [Desulfotomaculaceae bacterium]